MPAVLSQKIRRIARFFGIKDTDVPMWLGQIILPSLDVAAYVRDTQITRATFDISATQQIIWNVPVGKKRIIRAIQKGATVNAVPINLMDEAGIVVALIASATAEQVISLSIPAKENYTLRIAQGNALDGAIIVATLYEEEDA
jgi:hypothetical protein